MTGTFMTQIATLWLIYQLTQSAFLLGLAGFLSQLPTFLLAPLSGVFADRWHRHHLLIWVQCIGFTLSAALSLLTLLDRLSIESLLLLSTLAGVLRGLDVPVRQAFVIEMIERREDLTNAIALNASLINGARLIGPAIGGILIAAIGAGSCFLIDTISYVIVTIALLMMRVKSQPIELHSANIWQRLTEGFQYTYNFLPVRCILLLLSLVSLMGLPYLNLLPIFAVEILQGGPETLGFLSAASGIGAFTAAIYLSFRRSILGLGRLIAFCPASLGLSLIAFSLSHVFWFSLLMMAIAGFSSILQAASSNTIIQTIVDDTKRGRVMSFYTMSFMGMIPFGNLIAGSIANQIGAPNTLIVGGSCCVLGSVLFAKQLPLLRQIVRPIYHQIGIVETKA